MNINQEVEKMFDEWWEQNFTDDGIDSRLLKTIKETALFAFEAGYLESLR